MKKKNEVKVVAFISDLGSDLVKNPVPEDYLSQSEVPQELIEDLKQNGWSDENGTICFSKDYHPEPVKDEHGDVWLALNNSTQESGLAMTMMMKSVMLLDSDEIVNQGNYISNLN